LEPNSVVLRGTFERDSLEHDLLDLWVDFGPNPPVLKGQPEPEFLEHDFLCVSLETRENLECPLEDFSQDFERPTFEDRREWDDSELSLQLKSEKKLKDPIEHNKSQNPNILQIER
jgi:hypothetical protein